MSTDGLIANDNLFFTELKRYPSKDVNKGLK